MQKITISDKSISTGFKIFALEDSGYTYNWKCTRSDLAEDILSKKRCISVSVLNSTAVSFLNLIQSVIIHLIECLSVYISKDLSFHLFLDNLFVC